MIYRQNKQVIDIYKGTTGLLSVYLGNTLVWTKKKDEEGGNTPEVPDDNYPSYPEYGDKVIAFEVDTSIYKTVIIPFGDYNLSYHYTINWGDGTEETELLPLSNASSKLTHTYSDEGIYIVTITPTDKTGINMCLFGQINYTKAITKILSFGNYKYKRVELTKSHYPNLNYLGSGINDFDSSGTWSITLGDATLEDYFNGEFKPMYVKGFFSKLETTKSSSLYFNLDCTDVIGDPFEGVGKLTYCQGTTFNSNTNVTGTIHKLTIPNDQTNGAILGNLKVYRVKELTLGNKLYSNPITTGTYTKQTLCELFITNIGEYTGSTMNFNNLTNWGINNPKITLSGHPTIEIPEAKDSLVKSLITYSKDLTTENRKMTITLSSNTKNVLTEEEMAQITSKGYTIA